MLSRAGIGHNSGRSGRVYAIVFDLDIDQLKALYHNASWENAYSDVRCYLTSRGFSWIQGSGYFGDETINAVRCVQIVQRMAKKYPWFTPAVKDIRMLRIEENNDLKMILIDDDED